MVPRGGIVFFKQPFDLFCYFMIRFFYTPQKYPHNSAILYHAMCLYAHIQPDARLGGEAAQTVMFAFGPLTYCLRTSATAERTAGHGTTGEFTTFPRTFSRL